MRVDVYTWQDAYVATIGPDELLSFVHTDELNGEDSVAITTTFPLKQGYRLVWADRLGKAHEHVCQDPQGLHADGETLYTDTALNSVCELYGDYIEDKRPYGYSFANALSVALAPTRWEVGYVSQGGTVGNLAFYHTSAREALQAILDVGGEMETIVTVGNGGVSYRCVNIHTHRGDSSTHRRFTYTKDLASIARTEHYGAITACYGYGKGVETDSGGYGRKLTFGDINGGLNYVADEDARKAYGRPDGNGGFAHVFGRFEDSQCEDAETLLAETRAYLDSRKEPGVTYEADVVDLVQFGRSWEGVAVGDDVQIIDRGYIPELRCSGRVTKLVTDLLGGAMTVTLGNVTETMADILAGQQQQMSSLANRSSNWDVAASTPAAYLQQVVDGLNEQFNTQGMSYCYTSFEQGTVWASVPLDADGRPTKTGGSAIQICSQGFRIASGTKADGSWDWRTFGTGKGFTADCITAGTIAAGLITAGILQDKAGNNYWNLDTGEFSLSASSTVGGKGIATSDGSIESLTPQYAKSASRTTAPTTGWQSSKPIYEVGKYVWQRYQATMQDGSTSYTAAVLADDLDQDSVFNRLTRGGTQQGIYLQDGKVYINGEYIKADTVQTSKLVSEDGASMCLMSYEYDNRQQTSLVTESDNGGVEDTMRFTSGYSMVTDGSTRAYVPHVTLEVFEGAANQNAVSLELSPKIDVPGSRDLNNPAFVVNGCTDANTNPYIRIPQHGDYGGALIGSTKAYLRMVATEGGKASLYFHSGDNFYQICQINAG